MSANQPLPGVISGLQPVVYVELSSNSSLCDSLAITVMPRLILNVVQPEERLMYAFDKHRKA
jgi:hypothetical protein